MFAHENMSFFKKKYIVKKIKNIKFMDPNRIYFDFLDVFPNP
jgi:hypothetical protein